MAAGMRTARRSSRRRPVAPSSVVKRAPAETGRSVLLAVTDEGLTRFLEGRHQPLSLPGQALVAELYRAGGLSASPHRYRSRRNTIDREFRLAVADHLCQCHARAMVR